MNITQNKNLASHDTADNVKNAEATKPTTHFGFSEVVEEQKQGMVKHVFENVAASYDLMNDAMSFGLHRDWKDRFIDMMHPSANQHLLDVAGGTGDIGFRFLNAGGGKVTLCDINEAMLGEGKRRAIDENIAIKHANSAVKSNEKLTWVAGNAEALPCSNNQFDLYSIAFGIRNVTHIENALAEAYRALKFGGKFMCLEFSHPTAGFTQKVYDFYSFNIIPKMGKALANDAESYQYLVESIRQFPKQEAFKEMIENAGFSRCSYQNLSGGIVAIHTGWKI